MIARGRARGADRRWRRSARPRPCGLPGVLHRHGRRRVASSAVGIVQVFAPEWPDGNWVARTRLPGRAVGNMRQPNHLSSLLLWAVVAALWLVELASIRRWVGAALALLFASSSS